MAKHSYNEVMDINAKSSPKSKSGPKVTRSIEVEKAENGGWIVRHRFDNSGNGAYREPEEYVFGKSEGAKASAHILKHSGVSGASEEAGEKEHGAE